MVGVFGVGSGRRMLDGGDDDLQHSHPKQRTTLGTLARVRVTRPVSAGLIRFGVSDLGCSGQLGQSSDGALRCLRGDAGR